MIQDYDTAAGAQSLVVAAATLARERSISDAEAAHYIGGKYGLGRETTERLRRLVQEHHA